ncbi:MAG TPA: hypothetical protein VGE52_15250, partial [Pirellulales bacterium]
GNAGSRYNNGDYTIRRELDSFTDWGEFSYVEPSQSAIVSQAAWALELGVTVSEAEVNQLRNKLSPGDKAALNEMLDRFVEKQSTKMKTLAAGTTKADKLAAADVAASLSTSFKTRPEGKEAKAVLAELKKDKDLKPEWLAKADFERASAMPNPAMRMQALASLAKKLPDTVYGGKAAAAIIASQATAGGE